MASVACLDHPGSLEIVSKTCAAAAHDVETPAFNEHNEVARVTTKDVAAEYNTSIVFFKFDVQFQSLKDDINPGGTRSVPVCLLSRITSDLFFPCASCHA